MSDVRKETPAQRAERIKREKVPYDLWDDLVRWARERRDFSAIPPEDLKTRLRWWGLYTQGDGEGVHSREKGSSEGKAVPFFMLRIKIPNGHLRAHQLRTIGEIANRCARGFGDVTVRENIQLHWIAIEDVPGIITQLNHVGLTTLGACGDVTRNIVGCPVSGADPEELCDASPLVMECHRMLIANREVYNLPRKWKICITGCKVWCPYPEINDIGMTAAIRRVNGRSEIGFNVRVGGGLSTLPHFARKLNVFARWNEVPLVVKTITEIFRDADVLRENRERARMKFLFTHFGWTEEKFEEELTRRLGFRLLSAAPEEIPTDTFRDHVGVHAQKQSGYFYVGASILAGRITGDQMLAVADLSERYGDGTIRTTNTQNMVLLNVPERHLEPLTRELNCIGLPTDASHFRRGAIACTGKQFCKLSLTETKNVTMDIVAHLQQAIPEFDVPLKLHVTGCPNSCGQHWIADIGLQGGIAKLNGKPVEAYDFYVGGGTGKDATFTRRLKYKAPLTEVKFAVERLCRAYLTHRQDGESFHAFCQRHSDEELVAFLRSNAAIEELVTIPAEVVNPLHQGREAHQLIPE